MKNNTIISRLSKSAAILRILGILLVLIAFAVFIYNSQKQESNLNTQNIAILKKDSLITKIELKVNRTDTLKAIVASYFKYRALHNAEALSQFYADTITNYYKYIKNCKKEDIKLSATKYWQKYPKDSFHIKSDPEIILNDKLAKAIIHGQIIKTANNTNSIEEIIEIQFDLKNKIKSIKSYYSQ